MSDGEEPVRWTVYLKGAHTSTVLSPQGIELGAERIDWAEITAIEYPASFAARLVLTDGSSRQFGFESTTARVAFAAAVAEQNRNANADSQTRSLTSGVADAGTAADGKDGSYAPQPDQLASPSLLPTAVISFLFGIFGLIPATIHSRMARDRGYPTGRYWAAFAAAMAAALVVWLGGSVALVTAASGSSGPAFTYPASPADTSSNSDAAAEDNGTGSSDSSSEDAPTSLAAVTWNSDGEFVSSSSGVGSQSGGGPNTLSIPFDNSANEQVEYTTVVNQDHSALPTPVFLFPDGSGCMPNVHGIPDDAQAPAGATGSLTYSCLPPGNYVLASVRADQVITSGNGTPTVADDAWQFTDLTVATNSAWDGVCVRDPVDGSSSWSIPPCT